MQPPPGGYPPPQQPYGYPQQPGYSPQQGYPSPGQPPPQGPPPVAWYQSPPLVIISMIFCFPFGLIGLWTSPKFSTGARIGVTIGWMLLVGIGATRSGKNKRGAEAAAEMTASLPWVKDVQSACKRYKDAPNQIKKSAIFKENEEALADVTVDDVKGELKSLATNQGGAELRLQIDVGSVEFKTESMFAAIKKGSDVYDAAENMKEGDCVRFSAKKIKAASIVEQSKVCDTEYFAEFTKLRPCK